MQAAAIPATVNGVELEQVGGGRGVTGGVIDVDDLDAGAAPEGTEHQPADAAESVDADAHASDGQEPENPIGR